MNVWICIYFGIFLLGSQSHSFLNNIHLTYVRNILTNSKTPMEIRKRTQKILCEQYLPWLNKQVRVFYNKNVILLTSVMECELHQYALNGFLEAIYRFDGNISLVKYAEKYVHSAMIAGVAKHTIILKPAHDKGKIIDSQFFLKETSRLYPIKNIVLMMPTKYQRVFFARYDSETLRTIKSVYRICRVLKMSDETYRKKMNVVKRYLLVRLRKTIF